MNNMIINDPKGELARKFFVPGTYRGLQIVQWNLINPSNTDIYNPLILAAEAAREGDYNKTAAYVEGIANVFFPLDGGEDPVWPNSANNAFKRAAYGLIDYYLEEERELREEAARTGMDQKALEIKLDILWGRVTLYNCYQLFTQMASKKSMNPLDKFNQEKKKGEYENLSPDEVDRLEKKAKKESELYGDQPELDHLTLYFNATAKLPVNEMRRLVLNADNALKSMAGAEKMLASSELLQAA